MEITSLTYHYNTLRPHTGCAIDAEAISRFDRLCLQENPLPLVFSTEEFLFALKHSCPAFALCAAFCCKEAFLKAVEQPYDWRLCRLFLSFPGSHPTQRDNSKGDGSTGGLFQNQNMAEDQDCLPSSFLPQAVDLDISLMNALGISLAVADVCVDKRECIVTVQVFGR